jgi:hypothetical protein
MMKDDQYHDHGGSERFDGRYEFQGAFSRKPVPGEKECSLGMERRMHQKDRRHRHADGYMWISTVGWICRRENRRRGEDPDPFGC